MVLPSFFQTADAQSCPYNGGCVTGYGYGNTPIEDWSWVSDPYSGGSTNYGGGSSGGGGGNNAAQEHADYCEIVSNTVTMFSGMRIVSTADSLLTLGGMSADYATLTVQGALADIAWFDNLPGDHAPPKL